MSRLPKIFCPITYHAKKHNIAMFYPFVISRLLAVRLKSHLMKRSSLQNVGYFFAF